MFLPFEIINFIFYFILTITTATLFTDCTTALHSAWHKARMKSEDEIWLRENCRDPIFFSKMKSHTNICSEVEANARIGAFWAALHDVVESCKISWYPWTLGCTGYVFCFLFWFICCHQFAFFKREWQNAKWCVLIIWMFNTLKQKFKNVHTSNVFK